MCQHKRESPSCEDEHDPEERGIPAATNTPPCLRPGWQEEIRRLSGSREVDPITPVRCNFPLHVAYRGSIWTLLIDKHELIEGLSWPVQGGQTAFDLAVWGLHARPLWADMCFLRGGIRVAGFRQGLADAR